jgi:hypothetical protein
MRKFDQGVLVVSLSIIANSVQASDVGTVIQTTGAASEKVIKSVGDAIAKNNVLCRGDLDVDKVELLNDIETSGGSTVDTTVLTKNCNGDITFKRSKIINRIKASSRSSVKTGLTN